MNRLAFDEVAWKYVYDALHSVPRLFRIWTSKQVTNTTATNERGARWKENHDPKFPSCDSVIETCSHMLHCRESGRVDLLQKFIQLVEDWLKDVRTEPHLRNAIAQFARGRGGMAMAEAAHGGGLDHERMAL